MGSAQRAAAGVTVIATVALLAGCGGQQHGVSWAACQDAGNAMERLTDNLQEGLTDDNRHEKAAQALDKSKTRMEDVADNARADDVTDEADEMAEYLGDLRDGYADEDEDVIIEKRRSLRKHADRFVEACHATWERQL